MALLLRQLWSPEDETSDVVELLTFPLHQAPTSFCPTLWFTTKNYSTWQEALEHCREHHTDLSSMVFETENLLALREMKPLNIDRVWIGLRYLGDRWLWVNGDPLEYEAWGGVQDHQCPLLKRCGALTIRGQWENRDCHEKLNFICY
uniref:C-type lectin domain-containing protein n=1 Tax=Cyclopterus lumpus TaxID=8103 RepID=A0A8C3B0Z8_CYCLU